MSSNKPKRIFLLPGFGENEQTFRKLKSYFTNYELVDVDYRPLLALYSISNFTTRAFVNRLIITHKITENDILIGHSIGGNIAYNISQLTNSPTCLLCSFTDPKKVAKEVKVEWIAERFIALTGLRNSFIAKRISNKYKNRPSHEEMMYVMQNFKSFKKAHLRMVYQFSHQAPLSTHRPPDLRIHALKDRVVYTPDEPFEEVPGDHFCHILHHQKVAEIILKWLGT